MSDTLEFLEQRLVKAYAEQVKCYDSALAFLDSPQSLASHETVDDKWLLELQRALNDVGVIDRAISEDKVAWQQGARSPGDPLRKILEEVGQRIRKLAEIVDHKVAVLSAKRRQLMPELDGFISQRRMLKAYDQYASLAKSVSSNRVS